MLDPNNHYIKIYRSQGRSYHELISFEDTDQNLRPALESITPFDQQPVLDLGTGTGRLPLLFPEIRFIGLDLHIHMLREHQSQFPYGIRLIQSDMRRLPFPEHQFGIITAGWAIGHFISWYPNNWKDQAGQVLGNAMRCLKPGGWLIIIETMTTGSKTPAPPTPGLAEYYHWLEEEWGFCRQVIQTDYQFESLDQAVAYVRFFFGEDLGNMVRKNSWVRLPEWTGIWSKQLNAQEESND